MLHFQTLKPVIVRRADVPAIERDVPTINDPLGFQNLHRHFAAIAIGERVMSGLSKSFATFAPGRCIVWKIEIDVVSTAVVCDETVERHGNPESSTVSNHATPPFPIQLTRRASVPDRKMNISVNACVSPQS